MLGVIFSGVFVCVCLLPEGQHKHSHMNAKHMFTCKLHKAATANKRKLYAAYF